MLIMILMITKYLKSYLKAFITKKLQQMGQKAYKMNLMK